MYSLNTLHSTLFTKGFITLCLLLGSVAYPTYAGEKVMTVCDLLKDLRMYRGKVITVRGIVYESREIFALGGRDCSTRFVTNGFAWPNAISLESSDYPSQEYDRAEFRTDDDALLRLQESIRLTPRGEGRPEVWATFVGQLRVRHEYISIRMGDGSIRGNGYGHLAWYPAQLVIKTVRDIAVVQPSTR
jgi:hypothetical protein